MKISAVSFGLALLYQISASAVVKRDYSTTEDCDELYSDYPVKSTSTTKTTPVYPTATSTTSTPVYPSVVTVTTIPTCTTTSVYPSVVTVTTTPICTTTSVYPSVITVTSTPICTTTPVVPTTSTKPVRVTKTVYVTKCKP
ncbi:hypothetical protein BB559_005092, partial [Furculomyces boomerangus]